MFENIKKHLRKDGIFVCSVANWSDMTLGVEHHVTQENKEWWTEFFHAQGLEVSKDEFLMHEFPRGTGNSNVPWGRFAEVTEADKAKNYTFVLSRS
jgi:hypothetical protein